jgi:hypothetical protein
VGTTIAFGAVMAVGCLGAGAVTPQRLEPPTSGSGPASTVASSPERLAPPSPQATDVPSLATAAPREAIATANVANGHIEIVIGDPRASCGPHVPFPSTCEPAWRIRIDLMPEHQRSGRYALGPELSPFSYRDAQGSSAGVWEAGAQCKNLGGHIVGNLEIVAIDDDGISGVLSGAGEADGPFRAQRCPSCKGTGNACSKNGECCTDFCHRGRCQP